MSSPRCPVRDLHGCGSLERARNEIGPPSSTLQTRSPPPPTQTPRRDSAGSEPQAMSNGFLPSLKSQPRRRSSGSRYGIEDPGQTTTNTIIFTHAWTNTIATHARVRNVARGQFALRNVNTFQPQAGRQASSFSSLRIEQYWWHRNDTEISCPDTPLDCFSGIGDRPDSDLASS